MKKTIGVLLTVILLFSFMADIFADSVEEPMTEPEAQTTYPAGNPEEVAAVILHTNDVHVGYQDNIGYDGLELYKKELESMYEHVLLVDAGDAIQGAALGAMSKGAEIIKMMNRLGYDLAIPGNHEFDFGFDVLDDCSEQLSCGYICANFCTADGEPVFRPWRILEAGDLKIGFVGVVTPDTFTRSAIKDVLNEVGEPMYDFLADETGDRLSSALQKNIDEVRANGADVVILVSHLGMDEGSGSIYASDAILGNLTGIDAVIDGHTHEVYNTTIPDKEGNQIPIAQTGTKLPVIGQLTVYKDGRLEEKLVDPVPLCPGFSSEQVTRKETRRYVDPDMKAFLDDITASYAPVMERKIGNLSVDLIKTDGSTDFSRTQENGLCELVADAFAAIGGTQAALCNAGSVRTNLLAGEVTYQDIVDILPYCNEVVTARVSGRMILDALEFGVSFLPEKSGGFPQVSGITFRIDPAVESSVKIDEKKQFLSVEGERRVSDVMINGRELDPDGSYTFAITLYLLTGGDGYTMFQDSEIINDTMLADNEAVMKYIEENLKGEIPGDYADPQGRIQQTVSMTFEEYMDQGDEAWFLTGKNEYSVQAMMVSKETSFHNELEVTDYTATDDGITVILKGRFDEMWTTKLPKVISTYTKPDGSTLCEADFARKDSWIDIITKPEPDAYFAIHVPLNVSVTVETAWGDTLHTNLPNAPHGDGDYLVCRVGEDGKPDLSDVWVLNGMVFPEYYDTSRSLIDSESDAA